MTLQSFKDTLSAKFPPENFSPCLKALWHEANKNWDEAHRIIQEIDDHQAAWVHAYLHRAEGDLANAAYWYSRAGKSMPGSALTSEWEELVTAM